MVQSFPLFYPVFPWYFITIPGDNFKKLIWEARKRKIHGVNVFFLIK